MKDIKVINNQIPYGRKTVTSSFTAYLDDHGIAHLDITDGFPANAIPKLWAREPRTAPEGIYNYDKDEAGHITGMVLSNNKEDTIKNIIDRCVDFQKAMNALKYDYEQKTGDILGPMDAPKLIGRDIQLPNDVVEKGNMEIDQMVKMIDNHEKELDKAMEEEQEMVR